MAAPALQRFYANLRRLRRRLLVFILPSAVALLIILGGELYPEWMRTYMMYLAPVALFALTVFAYSLLNTSEDLRAERASTAGCRNCRPSTVWPKGWHTWARGCGIRRRR